MGLEARLKGVNVLVGPSMGPLGMMPAGGRNWEGFGSDPVLQGIAAAETIRGIQQNGVMATAKHYVMNEQEHFRRPYEWNTDFAISSNIDDRALHEVFVWPFAESIRADVASVMCSYQRVNNSYACENSKILNGILKDELDFQGFVQSDWHAQRSGVNSALSGMDMNMPGDGLRWTDGESLWGSQLTKAVLNTSIPFDRLNDMVTRIVASWYHFGQDSWERPPPEGEGGPNFSSWTNDKIGRLHEGSDDNTTGIVNRYVDAKGKGGEAPDAHMKLIRSIAAEGTVLLKNVDGMLPLSRYPEIPVRVGIYGEDAFSVNETNACPDRGCNRGTLASGWGSGAVDFPYLVSPFDALQSAWMPGSARISGYGKNGPVKKGLEDKGLCIVFANADGGEGYIRSGNIHGDRNDLFLQKDTNRLIESVARGCGNGKGKTIVVIHAIGPVLMESWIDLPGVHAVLLANLPGQESGKALVDVLFGTVDASGRLPYTIGRSIAHYGRNAQILYDPNGPEPQYDFTDGLYIDYRYFDRHDIAPRFEFGFGLSYTTFELQSSIKPLRAKSALPSPRPEDEASAPSYDTTRPDPALSLFPPGFRKLHKYVYPYLSDLDNTEPAPYPYPEGYDKKQIPSPAGGRPGGNPSLYDPHIQVQVQVKNTGVRPGKEVVQAYVSFPDNVVERPHRLSWHKDRIEFPVRVLRNFSKVEVQPGEAQSVEMTLSRKDLSYWSVRKQNWVMPQEGKIGVWVGRSSRDLKLVGEY